MSTGVQARGGTSPTGSIATRGVRASSNYDRRTGVSSTTGDPFWSSVVLLVGNDNAVNGTATFLDQSSSGKTVTKVGTPTYTNTSAPTGMTTSVNLNGSTDELTLVSHADFNYGTGDFTIEFMARATVIATSWIVDQRAGGTTEVPEVRLGASGEAIYEEAGNIDIISAGSTITQNNWFHWAASRVSGSTKLFVAGTQVGSTFTDAFTYIQSAVKIGAAFNDSAFFTGQVCCLRITKGVGRYSGAFTPPTLPLLNH